MPFINFIKPGIDYPLDKEKTKRTTTINFSINSKYPKKHNLSINFDTSNLTCDELFSTINKECKKYIDKNTRLV